VTAARALPGVCVATRRAAGDVGGWSLTSAGASVLLPLVSQDAGVWRVELAEAHAALSVLLETGRAPLRAPRSAGGRSGCFIVQVTRGTETVVLVPVRRPDTSTHDALVAVCSSAPDSSLRHLCCVLRCASRPISVGRFARLSRRPNG
jgi:hypothetical protein